MRSVLLVLAVALSCRAQDTRSLPQWLDLSAEYRVRAEGFLNEGFRHDVDDGYALSRLRVITGFHPVKWFRVQLQGQDSRVVLKTRRPYGPPFQDRADLRWAYVDLGDPENDGPTLRAGRQTLSFGGGRLVGDPNWSNVGRTFDAVRGIYRYHGYRVDAFVSSVVRQRDGDFNEFQSGDNFHGLYGTAPSLIPGGQIEPYLFWRARAGGPTGLHFRTYGVRLTGKLPARLDYTVEMARQGGENMRQTVSAWAGQWVLGRKLSGPLQPRIFAEHNYASGDETQNDERYNTFDQLYAAAHDKLGFIDQVGWRNIRHYRAGVELQPWKTLLLQSSVHSFWLASARDALYTASGAQVVRDSTGSSGTYVGWEWDAQLVWTPRKQISVGAGYGFLHPGEFLKNTVQNTRTYHFPHAMISYSF